jgi:murein DD-endopeptidase MepM/ murein hydrolase activator NlpD
MRLFWVFVLILGSGCSTPSPLKSWRDRSVQLERRKSAQHEEKEIDATEYTESLNQAGLIWPLRNVTVTSRFGKRQGEVHEGIDLKAAPGTPVYAAQSGWVVYAGSQIRGYGGLVVLRHGKRISTVYAHNSKLLVKEGQSVKQGQLIAYSGNTGRSTGPHLHFEVRVGLDAIDPLSLRQDRVRTSVASTKRERKVAGVSK